MLFSYILCSVVIFSSFTYGQQGGQLLVPCNSKDLECLDKATHAFLEQTHKGIPQYNIHTIDPLKVDNYDVDHTEKYGKKHHGRNLVIEGFKNQKVKDFKLDKLTQEAILTVEVDLTVSGDLDIEYVRPVHKNFSGQTSFTGKYLLTTRYPYSIVTRDNVDHFEVGKEVTQCRLEEVKSQHVSQDLLNALDAEPELKPLREKFLKDKDELVKKAGCDIVKEGFKVVVDNIRSSARVLPKTAYLTDL